jgi:hypothetical protein
VLETIFEMEGSFPETTLFQGRNIYIVHLGPLADAFIQKAWRVIYGLK